jgi:uncharacterized membrane protein YphA (DoxX/SURF4 family)
MLAKIVKLWQTVIHGLSYGSFLAPLSLRLLLAPTMFIAGYYKFLYFGSTVGYFRDTYGITFAPEVMTFLATSAEMVGGILLLLGIGVRFVSIPLMITMIVAAFMVHWQNGWFALADKTFCLFNCSSLDGSIARKDKAIEILQANGNYEWLTATGKFTIINNGIEFAAIYFFILLALFFMGPGRVSFDHFIYWMATRNQNQEPTDSQYAGFGGFLIVPTIALIALPLAGIVLFALDISTLLQAKTSWLLITELILVLVVIALLAFTVLSYFKQKKRTPTLVILLLVTNFAVTGALFTAEYLFGFHQMIAAKTLDPVIIGTGKSLIAAGIIAGIFIPYFEVSKRVKATFVN